MFRYTGKLGKDIYLSKQRFPFQKSGTYICKCKIIFDIIFDL